MTIRIKITERQMVALDAVGLFEPEMVQFAQDGELEVAQAIDGGCLVVEPEGVDRVSSGLTSIANMHDFVAENPSEANADADQVKWARGDREAVTRLQAKLLKVAREQATE